MALGKYSPTVEHAYREDQDWHRKYANGEIYDPEGYDSYGYNSDDKDRAGHEEWEYSAVSPCGCEEEGEWLYDRISWEYRDLLDRIKALTDPTTFCGLDI